VIVWNHARISCADQISTAGYSSTNTPSAPASGGADGSLLLSDAEIARSVNDPLGGYRSFLLNKYNFYKSQKVSAADFVQAAGNIAVASCGGPVVQTVSRRVITYLFLYRSLTT